MIIYGYHLHFFIRVHSKRTTACMAVEQNVVEQRLLRCAHLAAAADPGLDDALALAARQLLLHVGARLEDARVQLAARRLLADELDRLNGAAAQHELQAGGRAGKGRNAKGLASLGDVYMLVW